MAKLAALGRSLLTMAGGAASGLVVALVVSARLAPAKEPPSPPRQRVVEEGARALPREVRAGLSDERLAAVERRMAELESRDAGTITDAPPERGTGVDPAAQHHLAAVAAHEAARRDERWAPHQERELTTRLTEIQGRGLPFSVASIDCRTTTCVARLRWPDEKSAHAGVKDLMRESMILRCAREVYIPPAAPGSARYETSMHLDCADVQGQDDGAR